MVQNLRRQKRMPQQGRAKSIGNPRLRIRQNRGVSIHWGGVSAVERDFGYAASLSRCRITLANRAMNSPLVGFPRLALTVLPK